MLPRVAGAERMDEPDQDPGELARSLADLRGVNRWLGGTRVILHHLGRLISRHPRPSYRILDVATGSGDIPLRVAAWARRKGIALEMVATDNHPTIVALAERHTAAEPAVRVQAADALGLAFGDGEFDFALCSTALHHFDEMDDAIRVLRELNRVSSIGWIVNDLARSRPALAGARLLAATVWRAHPVTAHDGPLSIRRSFTADELRALARAAGISGATVHRHVLFRVALVCDRAKA